MEMKKTDDVNVNHFWLMTALQCKPLKNNAVSNLIWKEGVCELSRHRAQSDSSLPAVVGSAAAPFHGNSTLSPCHAFVLNWSQAELTNPHICFIFQAMFCPLSSSTVESHELGLTSQLRWRQLRGLSLSRCVCVCVRIFCFIPSDLLC